MAGCKTKMHLIPDGSHRVGDVNNMLVHCFKRKFYNMTVPCNCLITKLFLISKSVIQAQKMLNSTVQP